jgi:hypothetical protein
MEGVGTEGRVSAIPPGGAPDTEVAELMHDLSRMQTWAVMLATRQTPGAREAMDLIQRTRCLIVERLYPSNVTARANTSTLEREGGGR